MKTVLEHGSRWVLSRAQDLEVKVKSDDDDIVLDDFPRAAQLDRYSCGLQSTIAILEYFGCDFSTPDLKKRLRTSRKGTYQEDIERVLREEGLRCSRVEAGRKKTVMSAIRRGSPLLVSVDDGEHWAVVFGAGPEKVYVADPSMARSFGSVVNWKEFRERWDKQAVVVSRSKVRVDLANGKAEVTCPVSGEEVRIVGEPGDEFWCTDCKFQISWENHGPVHVAIRWVTCPWTKDRIAFPDDGDTYACRDCGSDLSVENGRARHVR